MIVAVGRRPIADGARWSRYLADYHSRRPGITETILGAARDRRGGSPYAWLADALPGGGLVVDLACGSGPLGRLGTSGDDQFTGADRNFVGIDRSEEELSRAAGSRLYLVKGDLAQLPFSTSAFPQAACSMALMVVPSAAAVLDEIRRVLAPGGTAAFLLPGTFPASRRDLWRYASLMRAFRRVRPAFPNQIHRRGLRCALHSAGFDIVDDRRRRYIYAIGDETDARCFALSFYAPESSDLQAMAAVRIAARWIGSTIGIPLRRIVCRTAWVD